jgi:hypothetical protein
VGWLRLGRKPGRRRLRMPLPPWRRPLSFLFHHPVGANDCQCASPIIAGESGNGSARCDGDRRHPPSSIHAMMLASARLSPLWASPGAALRGVAAAGTFLPPSRRCAPPAIVGESGNGSTCCGGGRPCFLVQAWTLAGARLPPMRASPGASLHGVAVGGTLPSLSRRGRLPVRASH